MERLVGWGELSGDKVEVGQDNSLETWRASEMLPGGWRVSQSTGAIEGDPLGWSEETGKDPGRME